MDKTPKYKAPKSRNKWQDNSFHGLLIKHGLIESDAEARAVRKTVVDRPWRIKVETSEESDFSD